MVALTFDDGPSEYTPKILKVLKKEHVHATFFVVGEEVNEFPALVRQAADEGNEVEDHSWTHPHLVWHGPHFIRTELETTRDAITKATGVRPHFFRPPYGQYHLGIMEIAHSLGLTTVLWSVTGYDWLEPGVARIVQNVTRGLAPGAIILLHDAGGNREQTVEALEQIIPLVEQREFQFVLLRDLFQNS